MDAHPGNAIAATNNRPNPIKMWAEDRVTYPGWYLTFPSEHETKRHPMMRWDTNSYPPNFILVRSGGGQARFGDVISFRDLSDEIKTDEVAAYFGAPPVEGGAGVLICGSEGEIANDPSLGAIFASENPDGESVFDGLRHNQAICLFIMIFSFFLQFKLIFSKLDDE